MRPFVDLTGQRFGRLKVIKKVTAADTGEKYSNQSARWLCQCDCGEKTVVQSSALIGGKTKSCGCYRKEKTKALGQSNKGKRKSKRKKGNRLYALLMEKGMTPEELAEKLDIYEGNMNRWMYPDKAPNAMVACRIADYLGTTVEALWGEFDAFD